MRPPWFMWCYFCPDWLSNCIQNARFMVPSHHEKWDDIPYRKIYIAIGVFQMLHHMYENDEGSFWAHHLRPSYGSHHAISALIDYLFAYQILNFGYPLSIWMGYCTTKRYTHCWWCVSQPSWDKHGSGEELMTASTRPLWFVWFDFGQGWLSNCKIWGKKYPISEGGYGCYTIRRDINCCWSIS